MSELPESWATASLGSLVEINPKTAGLADDALVGFVPMALVGKSYLDVPRFETRPWEEVKHGYTHFRDADVLLAKITPCFENSKAGIASELPNGVGAGSTEFFVCRPRTGAIDPRYLLAFLKREEFLRVGAAQMTGSVGHKRLPKQFLADQTVPLAPRAEQTRIADQLDTLMARIRACQDRLDAVPTLLKRFRGAVLDAATLGELTETWREARGLTAEWTTLTLQDIADVQGGLTKDAKKQSALDEEVPYLRVANVQRGYIDLGEVRTIRVPAAKLNHRLLEPGDILFNEGGDLDKLGRGWIWEGQLTRCTFQNHVFRARLRNPSNQPKFVSWWGNSRGLEYFLRSGKQTTNLASINKTMLQALPIRLPTPEEQAEIVRRVEALFKLADRIESRYNAATAQAQRLTSLILGKAFRGELVPQDHNDEPASTLLAKLKAANSNAAVEPSHRRAKAPGKRPSMSNTDKGSIKAAILKLKTDHFSFDELRAQVSGDYESLKAALFELLEEPSPVVRQVFDTKAKAMRLVRVMP